MFWYPRIRLHNAKPGVQYDCDQKRILEYEYNCIYIYMKWWFFECPIRFFTCIDCLGWILIVFKRGEVPYPRIPIPGLFNLVSPLFSCPSLSSLKKTLIMIPITITISGPKLSKRRMQSLWSRGKKKTQEETVAQIVMCYKVVKPSGQTEGYSINVMPPDLTPNLWVLRISRHFKYWFIGKITLLSVDLNKFKSAPLYNHDSLHQSFPSPHPHSKR